MQKTQFMRSLAVFGSNSVWRPIPQSAPTVVNCGRINRSMIACDQPPIVRRLKVSNIGETYATLQWQLSGSHGGYYGLELNYKQKGEVPSTQYQLSKWETLAVVRNLEANTTYLATLFTANQCARTDPAFTTFRTKATTLHPNLFKVMPHEIILTAVVMFIWMLIVRHFFKMYSHVAMVNPVTYGGYRMGAGEEEQAHTSSSSLSMKTPRTSLVPSSGNATLGSIQDNRGRSSTINSRAGLLRKHSSHSLHSHHTHPAIPPEERAALLAGAVEKWRSEAVLAHMEGIAVAATPVRSSLMRTAQSWTDIRQEGGKKKRRRCSTMSAPKHSAVPVVQLSIEEEDEEELESEDVDGDTGGDTGERKDSKDSIGSFSRPKQPWRSASLHVSSTEPERKRKVLVSLQY
uniref:Fibronectin type-III domain-containing protein n=1 Tax=Plectus sambesii TaxID=2011161 RepID=A0A914UI57_9BILA